MPSMKLAAASVASALAFASLAAAQDIVVNDVLNLVNQLSCLQAEFYNYAAYGTGLSAAQRGGGPVPAGAYKAPLSEPVAKFAREFAAEQVAHINLLRAEMGADALPCPQLNFTAGVTEPAAAAGFTDPPFDAFADEIFFLTVALNIEEQAMTAYVGSIKSLTTLQVQPGAPQALLLTVRIFGTKALHAGVLRGHLYTLYTQGVPARYGLTIAEAVQAGANVRNAFRGPSSLAQGLVALDAGGVIQPDAPTTLSPTDARGLIPGYSVSSVLAVLYAGSPTRGGFYPDGINGVFGPGATPPPEPAASGEPSPPRVYCSARYQQCGGTDRYEGPTCCEADTVCTRKSEFFSGCVPTALDAGIIPFYKKCSGPENVDRVCATGSRCLKILENYSKCEPYTFGRS